MLFHKHIFYLLTLENEADIQLCVTEIENGIQLLMPKPDDFFIPLNEGDQSDGLNSSGHAAGPALEKSSQEGPSQESVKTVAKSVDENDSASVMCNGKSSDPELIQNGKCENSSDEVSQSVQDSREQNSNSLCSEKDLEKTTDRSESIDDVEERLTSTCDEEYDVGSSFTREHGHFTHEFSLTINVGPKQSGVQQTEDNADIIEGVQGQYRLIKAKFLPRVKKWLQVRFVCIQWQDKGTNFRLLFCIHSVLFVIINVC